jgi:hypothetical protein
MQWRVGGANLPPLQFQGPAGPELGRETRWRETI